MERARESELIPTLTISRRRSLVELMPVSSRDPLMASESLQRAMSILEQRLRSLKQIPLTILAVMPASPALRFHITARNMRASFANPPSLPFLSSLLFPPFPLLFRFTAPFPPVPIVPPQRFGPRVAFPDPIAMLASGNGRAEETDIIDADGDEREEDKEEEEKYEARRGAEVVDVVIRFETSSQWPDDVTAVSRIKTAFYIQIHNALATMHGRHILRPFHHSSVHSYNFVLLLFCPLVV